MLMDMEWNKCPKCGFEGIMKCYGAVGAVGQNYICPHCSNQFGNLRSNRK